MRTEKTQKGGFYQSSQCNRIKFYLFAENKPIIQYFPAFIFSYFVANNKGNILKLLEIMKRCVLIFSEIIVFILTASKPYLQDASVVFSTS